MVVLRIEPDLAAVKVEMALSIVPSTVPDSGFNSCLCTPTDNVTISYSAVTQTEVNHVGKSKVNSKRSRGTQTDEAEFQKIGIPKPFMPNVWTRGWFAALLMLELKPFDTPSDDVIPCLFDHSKDPIYKEIEAVWNKKFETLWKDEENEESDEIQDEKKNMQIYYALKNLPLGEYYFPELVSILLETLEVMNKVANMTHNSWRADDVSPVHTDDPTCRCKTCFPPL